MMGQILCNEATTWVMRWLTDELEKTTLCLGTTNPCVEEATRCVENTILCFGRLPAVMRRLVCEMGRLSCLLGRLSQIHMLRRLPVVLGWLTWWGTILVGWNHYSLCRHDHPVCCGDYSQFVRWHPSVLALFVKKITCVSGQLLCVLGWLVLSFLLTTPCFKTTASCVGMVIFGVGGNHSMSWDNYPLWWDD